MPDGSRLIDWEAVRRRLQQGDISRGKALAEDPRHVEETYRRRAARLARPESHEAKIGGESAVLVFTVKSAQYALELQQLREVVQAPRITPVPGSPEELAGVINVGGRIEPVWETSLLLGLGRPTGPRSGSAVLLRGEDLPGALLVDQLVQVRPLRSGEWQPGAQLSSFAKGVTADMITLIETEALFEQGGFA